ncbi:hypothetical protein BH10ACT9_BH10ACT9_06520 [soil metagenome]
MTVTISPRGAMPDFDFALDDLLRVGILVDDQLWLERPDVIARVRAADLRGVAHRARTVREERPGVPVLVDINVMIAPDAQRARTAMEQVAPFTDDTLLYVGTPAGLAGLVTDIQALGIADGTVLIPLRSEEVLDLIRDRVLPELQTMAPRSVDLRGARPA